MSDIDYWIISPVYGIDENFDSIWKYDRTNGTIAIGWRKMDQLHNTSKKEALAAFDKAYPDDNLSRRSRDFNTIWRWYHEVSIGDVIIARKGTKRVIGLGFVKGNAYRDDAKSKERRPQSKKVYPHFLDIEWFMTNEDEFEDPVFSPYVFRKTTEEKIISLELHKLIPGFESETGDHVSEAPDQEFGLEKILRDFLFTNFTQIFPSNLALYEDPEGKPAKEYRTGVGPIDLLAFETTTNSFVVIELKKGRDTDKVVGQILRYMGWVNENMCKSGQIVKGIIVCKERGEKIRLALTMTKNITVKEYRMQFEMVDPEE